VDCGVRSHYGLAPPPGHRCHGVRTIPGPGTYFSRGTISKYRSVLNLSSGLNERLFYYLGQGLPLLRREDAQPVVGAIRNINH
jgi:hypothetical protein